MLSFVLFLRGAVLFLLKRMVFFFCHVRASLSVSVHVVADVCACVRACVCVCVYVRGFERDDSFQSARGSVVR